MLDGRVLGASQVEYKPFGKPPLKREDHRHVDQVLVVLVAEEALAQLGQPVLCKERASFFCPLRSRM